jgi:hypothetical protein
LASSPCISTPAQRMFESGKTSASKAHLLRGRSSCRATEVRE